MASEYNGFKVGDKLRINNAYDIMVAKIGDDGVATCISGEIWCDRLYFNVSSDWVYDPNHYYEKSMLPDRVPGPPPTYIEALAGDLAPYISDIRPLAMNDISGGVPAYRIDDAVWTAINLFARNGNLSGPLDAGFDGYVWSDLPYPDNSLVPSTYVIYPGVDRYPAGIDRSWGWQKAPVAIYMFLVFKLQLSHVAKVGNEVRLCSTCDVACASDCNATCFDGCHSACKGCNGCSGTCTNS